MLPVNLVITMGQSIYFSDKNPSVGNQREDKNLLLREGSGFPPYRNELVGSPNKVMPMASDSVDLSLHEVRVGLRVSS